MPAQAPYLEAFGAAHLARERGTPLPGRSRRSSATARWPTPAAARSARRPRWSPSSRRGAAGRAPGARYVLGVDGGSTTTKVALVDPETREIVASHYGRTLGDPVAALRPASPR